MPTFAPETFLVDSSGHVAFRALWAGRPGLLRDKLTELLDHERTGRVSANLGEQENLGTPLIHGAAELDPAVARAGKKAVEDFRREMGNVMYGFE